MYTPEPTSGFPSLISTQQLPSSLSDIEANANATEVIVTNHILSEELTSVFRRPALMRDLTPFVQFAPDVVVGSRSKKAILLNQRTSNISIAVAFAISVLIWLLVAFVVGLVRTDVETGCAVAGVGIGVMTLIAALTAWARK
ncbi:hypothetical protein B0T10DRAFT_471774 [Thelonectria olida]|uniref:Uncharacterized protein n=1 Tax=Thelonectria olida TaxID=1576542 RepID=A0A9P9AVD4_9HYPO|nr:hypothetical protein B0T10DRAFT_471774 [Thelonectria olida]